MLAILTSHPIQYQAPLWRSLAEDGRIKFEVWFLTPHATTPSRDQQFGQTFAWDQDLLAGYPNRFVPIAPNWNMNSFRGVRTTDSWREQFQAHGVTHLWVEGWRFWEFWCAIIQAHRLGIRVYLRGENNDLRPLSVSDRLIKQPILKYLFRHVEAFLTIGTASRRYYQRMGISDDRLHSAPYCVDNDAWATTTARLRDRRDEFRSAWNIPQQATCVMFCGKFIAKKRPLIIAEAARRAFGSNSNIHLLFVGDGELREALEESLARPDTPPSTITGFLNLSRISEAFVAADCLILPSDPGETWGLVVNEAMASGLPVAASKECGSSEDLVVPLDSELQFDGNDPQRVAEALSRLVNHPPPRAAILKQVHSHHFSATIETITQLYLRT
ncbi:glycosyltransferase family 4 protein [Opitutaceae bacterium]|jgi:glycosyltransferase involved in cell wall biosynthesis|nr:glycosyltransferase family 4 protein [Opitutaceae bacterium]